MVPEYDVEVELVVCADGTIAVNGSETTLDELTSVVERIIGTQKARVNMCFYASEEAPAGLQELTDQVQRTMYRTRGAVAFYHRTVKE